MNPVLTSVPELWHRLMDLVRIQTRILLFLSVTFEMPTKIIYIFFQSFAYYVLKVYLYYLKLKKSLRSHKSVEIKVFLPIYCLIIGESRSGSVPLTNGSRSGSWRPKNLWILHIRIQIWNTGLDTLPWGTLANSVQQLLDWLDQLNRISLADAWGFEWQLQ